ncbi:MAG: nucleoside-diphosphate sugar epimerase/dehydratase [Tetrasphaera sp.]
MTALTSRWGPAGPWPLVDGALWVCAVLLATFLRYDFAMEPTFTMSVMVVGALAALVHLAFGHLVGPYQEGHDRGSFGEITGLAKAVALTTLLVGIVVVVADDLGVPRSVPFIGGFTALVAMLAVRSTFRAWHIRKRSRAVPEDATPIIIFGAGSGGRMLVQALHDPASGYRPVALLDDDRRKFGRRIGPMQVAGTKEALRDVAEHTGARAIAIAIPSASSPFIRDMSARADALGLQVLVLPSARELLGRVGPADLRSLNLADLLGRRPVQLDEVAIADSIRGKVVLVTGAGGSIGSELCRQISKYQPARLILLDRDESALHATQLSLTGTALLESDDMALVDIRDQEALLAAFRQSRPDVVFHAAALKHLSLLERFPLEAYKTNVLGTRNVLAAARAVGVGNFVNISTDKAAEPTSVLGYSKRITERLTAGIAEQAAGTYVSVRFGNVLGSRGSVLETFRAQVERGGPVTVTHPEVRRFFMLIPEAAQLVLQASAIGRDGDVLVLDMGEQVRILDVAHTLIKLSGRHDVQVHYTGLRTGEKLAEDLFSGPEQAQPTSHELVSRVDVPALPAEELPGIAADAAGLTGWMRDVALATEVAAPRPRGLDW